VVAPKFQSLLLHIFSQASQYLTVNVSVDHGVRRNKFMVNNPLHVGKNNKHALLNFGPAAPFLHLVIVGSSTVTTAALFVDHNRKSKFRHPL
jgi:hypothetical protein